MDIKDLSKSHLPTKHHVVGTQQPLLPSPVARSPGRPLGHTHLDACGCECAGGYHELRKLNKIKTSSPSIEPQAAARGCFSTRLPPITINTQPVLRASWLRDVLNSSKTLPTQSEGCNTHPRCHIHRALLCKRLNRFPVAYVPVSACNLFNKIGINMR